jgi:hypothetical protein
MPEQNAFEYAVIRVVPRVDREEFINAGVILCCPAMDYLDAGIELNEERLSMLDISADIDLVRRHLEIIPEICAGSPKAGAIGRLARAQRFDWLTAPRSTIIQTSPVHTGMCGDPAVMLEHLMEKMVRQSGAII